MRRSISSKASLKSNAAARSSKAPPGTFALLPKGLPHRFQNLSDTPGKVLCVQSSSGIEEFFEHMSLLAKAGWIAYSYHDWDL
jgi:uncharacterized RmlC-like cupin family protein